MTSQRITLKDPPPGFTFAFPEQPLKVLVTHRGNQLVAQCLQFDIAVQGRSFAQIAQRFEHVLMSQILIDAHYGRTPFKDVKAAPSKYWDEYELAGATVSPPIREVDTSQLNTAAAIAHEATKRSHFQML